MLQNTSRKLKSSESNVADVREDEEQTIKSQEIVDLLVAAGYFRARIKGLSDFDKIIGGMTWCIESCNFDVDVDLLFCENSTIGQKISLTEKIVVMLPKMNCPYRIEPHQIQGLDSIHIFPVIQWLVKRSIEKRKETEGYMRAFALSQFHKRHVFLEDHDNKLKVKSTTFKNLNTVKKSYDPKRLFKLKDNAVVDESMKFLITLMEYDAPLSQIPDNTTSKSPPETPCNNGNKKSDDEKKQTDKVVESMAIIEDTVSRLSGDTVGNIVETQVLEIAKVAEQYATLSSKSQDDDVGGSSSALHTLRAQKKTLENRVHKLNEEKDDLLEKCSTLDKRISMSRNKLQVLEDSKNTKKVDFDTNENLFKCLEELLLVHEGLKKQEQEFREQCKEDLNNLQNILDKTDDGTFVEEERVKEYEELKEAVTRVRLQLAKKNRAIASVTRQLDDVPGRSELNQYQRRFMELYNQVSAKHKETKQYYTLYNTLDDTKLYLNKELTLLNSIQDNYNEAMASARGKEQFLKQLEAIVDGVKRNKAKVEKRCLDEKSRRDSLSQQLVTLIEQQRKYVAAVRQLTIECRENEALLAQLRGP